LHNRYRPMVDIARRDIPHALLLVESVSNSGPSVHYKVDSPEGWVTLATNRRLLL